VNHSWCLVVPAKPLYAAKSRLAAHVGPHRADLALAFAVDTVSAALRARLVTAVFAVTDDVRLGAALAAIGARIVPDAPDAGLNAALTHGAAVARAQRPACGVAALSADIPALRPTELDAALAAVTGHGRAFVADTQRFGTTLLAAEAGHQLAPTFGGPSRANHLRGGAYEIERQGLDSLRRDVDTPDDLAVALRLGAGPRTRAVVGRLAEGSPIAG
jgi:2-phospho-L-lactate guanylyltransferase